MKPVRGACAGGRIRTGAGQIQIRRNDRPRPNWLRRDPPGLLGGICPLVPPWHAADTTRVRTDVPGAFAPAEDKTVRAEVRDASIEEGALSGSDWVTAGQRLTSSPQLKPGDSNLSVGSSWFNGSANRYTRPGLTYPPQAFYLSVSPTARVFHVPSATEWAWFSSTPRARTPYYADQRSATLSCWRRGPIPPGPELNGRGSSEVSMLNGTGPAR